jgi:HEAT repeat protein
MFRRVARWFAERALLKAAQSPDPDVRRLTVEKLAADGTDWADGLLLVLLADAAKEVREAARGALQARGAKVRPGLIAALKGAAQPAVAVVIVELLGELGGTDAAEALVVALKYSERPVQMAARRALGRCGTEAVPILRAALTETQPWVRQQLTETLAIAEALAEPQSPN